MKAFSLTPPWSILVAIGRKRIETRSYPIRYRGPLAIHSTKGLNGLDGTGYGTNEAGLEALCRRDPFYSELAGFFGPTWKPSDIPRGAIVGITEIVNCVRMTPEWIATIDEPERSFGLYEPGRFGIILGPVEWLNPAIPAKGGLGLWDWDSPLEAEGELAGLPMFDRVTRSE